STCSMACETGGLRPQIARPNGERCAPIKLKRAEFARRLDDFGATPADLDQLPSTGSGSRSSGGGVQGCTTAGRRSSALAGSSSRKGGGGQDRWSRNCRMIQSRRVTDGDVSRWRPGVERALGSADWLTTSTLWHRNTSRDA